MAAKNNPLDFTPEQVALIKSQIAPKATDDELKLFLYHAKKTGLDPLARQIYCIHRKEDGILKMSIQTSIDGFRVVAERSGVYGGQSAPVFEEKDGWPVKCTISIYRFRGALRYEAAIAVVFFSEYAQTKTDFNTKQTVLTKMWAKMPHTMLAKVAEAVALRKAFPQDLSGLYTTDEMGQGDNEEGFTVTQPLQLPAATTVAFTPQYTQTADPVPANTNHSVPQQQPQAQQQTTPLPPQPQETDNSQLLAALAATKTQAEINALFKANNALVIGSPVLQQHFKTRELQIKNGGKPIPSDGQVKQVCERVYNGDLKAYDDAKAAFILNENQIKMLDDARMQFESRFSMNYAHEADILTMIEKAPTTQLALKLHQHNATIIDRTPELATKLNARLTVLKKAA